MNLRWLVLLPSTFLALVAVCGEVIKENDVSPNGWKIVAEPVGEPQLKINGNAKGWNTEWTTRSLGKGRKLGAVPDFLQELNSEYHGPDFDYFASFDNSNEKADESDYHFKTPYDSNDFLSHHQNPKTVPISHQNGWWIPHRQELKVQKNEKTFKNEAKFKNGKWKTSTIKIKVKRPKSKVSASKVKKNKKVSTIVLKPKKQRKVQKLQQVSGNVSKPNRHLKHRPIKKNKKVLGNVSKTNKHPDKKVIKMIKTLKKPTGTVIRKTVPKTKNSNKGLKDNNSKFDQGDHRSSRESSSQRQQVKEPLEKIVKGLVSGVQDILQLKKGGSEPVKGTWALSYKTNNPEKEGKNKTSPRVESNNLLLQFNNSNDNQEDWSLMFQRGRSDPSKSVDKGQSPGMVLNSRPRLIKVKGAKPKQDRINKAKPKIGPKLNLIQTEKGWSVVQMPKSITKKKIKDKKSKVKAKTFKVNKSKKKPKEIFRTSTKTILPTDEGWSVFKINGSGGKRKLTLKPTTVKKPLWIVNNSKMKPVKIMPSNDGWVESRPNKAEPKQEAFKKTYTKKFEPAKVVTIPKIMVTHQNQKKTKPATGTGIDVNTNLLKASNKDDENASLLESEKEQIQRNIKQGHAVDMKSNNIRGLGKVQKLKHVKKDDDGMSIEEGRNRIGEIMESIRKAGLDSPKNVKKVRPPRPKQLQDMSDLLNARSSEATPDVADGGEKDENKTTSEANLQASLHESLQSAMSGVVKVFSDKVDAHSTVTARGSLKNNVEQNMQDKKQRDASAPTVENKLDFSNVMWTPWSQWGSCSVSCGRGWITRRRFCLTITRKCDGRAIEMKFCHMKPCPEELMKASDKHANPQGEWSPWSPCSVTCGEGWTVRRKICYGRYTSRCSGPMKDIKRCRNHRRCISPLRRKLHKIKVLPVGEQVTWSEWSSCSATCGRGWRTRTRECDMTNLSKCTGGRFDIEKCSGQKRCKKHKGKSTRIKATVSRHHQKYYKIRLDSRDNRESEGDPKAKPGTEKKAPKKNKSMSSTSLKKRKDNQLIAKMGIAKIKNKRKQFNSKGKGKVTVGNPKQNIKSLRMKAKAQNENITTPNNFGLQKTKAKKKTTPQKKPPKNPPSFKIAHKLVENKIAHGTKTPEKSQINKSSGKNKARRKTRTND